MRSSHLVVLALRHKPRSNGASIYSVSYQIGPEPASDNHWVSGLDSKCGCLWLAYHPPTRIHAGFWLGQSRYRLDIGHLRDELVILAEQTFHTGQDYQKVGLAEYRHFCGQKVIVAESQFFDYHRIVFIDDRNDVPEAHQPFQCIPCVSTSCAAV